MRAATACHCTLADAARWPLRCPARSCWLLRLGLGSPAHTSRHGWRVLAGARPHAAVAPEQRPGPLLGFWLIR